MDTPGERSRWRAFALKTFGVPNDDEEQTRVFSETVRTGILRAYRQPNREFLREYVPDVPCGTYDGVVPDPAPVRLGRFVRRMAGAARRRLLALRSGRR
jgi:hypothetical protein